MIGAWFHCFSGIAGDMALGSLLDAGADLDEVRGIVAALGVPGWELSAEEVMRCGIGGTKAHVHLSVSTVTRTAASIDALLQEAPLPDRVRARSRAVFSTLASAEGHLHRKPVSQIHFHEVGALDAIVDVVGTCAALEVLGVDTVYSGPVTTGLGMVRAAHGTIPNPSPAVVHLLYGAPTRGIDSPVELTTPTGAALLAGLVTGWGPLPAMTITTSGFGAGSRELDGRPNLTQVVIGELDSTELSRGQDVMLLETNLDDVTGEVLSHAVAALLDAGAHDAWLTPIVMKKGRPGYLLSALADVALAGQIRRVIVAETGTLGVRGRLVERWPEARHFDTVEVGGHEHRVKVGPGRAKAEYADAASTAAATGSPLRDVAHDIETEWQHTHDHDHEHPHDHPHGHDHDHPHDHPHGHDHDHPDEHEHPHLHDHAHPHPVESGPTTLHSVDTTSTPDEEPGSYEEGPADPAS